MKNNVVWLLIFLFLWGGQLYAGDSLLTPTSKVVFEYTNTIRIETYDWPETLLTYPVVFRGNITEKDLVLIDMKTQESKVFQLSNIQVEGEYLRRADISFVSALRPGEAFRYELFVGKRMRKNETDRLSISTNNSHIEVRTDKISIRMPSGRQLQAHEAPAPIMALGQGKGWIGNNKVLSPNKRIISIQSKTINQGPLFIRQLVSYQFEGGGSYDIKITSIVGYPFVILDESISGLSADDHITMEMEWNGFDPVKRFGTQWDRTLEGSDAWLDIDKPVYTGYSKEDPRWTGMGWIEDPAKQMIFRISPYGGNSVREQTPVMSFWEKNDQARELGVFVFDNQRWNDHQYGIWQPTPALSVYFRYTDKHLYFTYPILSGSRSTALSFFEEKEGRNKVDQFNKRLEALSKRGGKHDPKKIFYRYSQLLLMQYASLSLDKIKDWQLHYPEKAKRPENLFPNKSNSTKEHFVRQMSISPMAYYPMGLNFYPGMHSIEHRILYSRYVEDYLRFYKELSAEERKTAEGLFFMGAYVNMLEEMNPIRNSLAGTANMASDGWSAPPQIAYLFPEHPMAKEWMEFFEKTLEIYGLFYTRPDVKAYESNGGRWVESLGVYNWAFLRPTSHSNIAGELFDKKNRFPSSHMLARARWMRDMLTAPITGKGRGYPPHGAHGGGYLVPQWLSFRETAIWLQHYDPILAEHMFWAGPEGKELEPKPGDTDWHSVYKQLHPQEVSGTNPHLKSTKYTGHGIVLRAGVDTPEELSIHLDQVDKGPNYRWGNQAEGNSGGLYFYAQGKVYTAHENEIAGDHIVNNLDGLTNFGFMKGGEFRTIGMNELKAPLYDFGCAQFAELRSDDGKDKYAWPEYLSRSVMLAGTDYFILFDETGVNWRAAGRFAWFNAKDHDYPKIVFLSEPSRKDHWMTAQTPNTKGFYRDNFGSVLTLVTHKKKEVVVEGGTTIPVQILDNSPDVVDFKPDKKNTLPVGVVKIKTSGSNDIVFRNGASIHYNGKAETFNGNAGLIRRFTNGRLEMSLFKGTSIGADGLTISVQPKQEAAVSVIRTNDLEVAGMVKTNDTVSLKIEGLPTGGRLYLNGVETKYQQFVNGIEVCVGAGTYQLEYTRGKAAPMESRIVRSEYEKNKVKLYVKNTSPSESILIELSSDGGKTWIEKGKTKNGIFYLSKESVGKVHVRAVSINGNKRAVSAPEYPVYFTSQIPHYPEGLWLKIDKNRVELSWGEILGAQKYRLYRKKQTEARFQLVYEGKDRQFLDTQITGVEKPYAYPGTLENRDKDRSQLTIYEYTVTAVNGNGESIKGPIENTDPASWKNWYPDTELRFKRQSAFWMEPYVYPHMSPDKYYED